MSDDALNGATIDLRYDVLGKLGAGSTGVVYRALDRLTGRFVALKKVKMAAGQTSPANPNQRLSLAHEFQALATLRHPSIVTVFDYGFDADDIPYLIMELLENAGTIRQVGQNQPLETRVSLLIQLLQALAYLHRRGIVHRDLKPGNVLVASGQVKMLDLGLAAARGQSIGSVGTLRYMAPEVLIGHPADVSTDLYGVGMIAYELFADHYLFDSADDADATILDPRQLVDRIMTIPPDALTAGLDPPIATILNRLLAKNPADRYTGAGQVIDALNELLDQPLPYETDVTRESFLQASQFIGRDSELAVLSEALAQAASGKGNVWLIRGESGVGKSRLVEELRVQALAQGMLVLRGQAIDEGRQPYQVWRDVLRRLCLQPSLTALEASVLKSVVPDIGVLVRRALPDAPTLDPQAAQERFVSVVEAILEHQTRPILIVLEDLQWSGSEGLALLGRLCRTVNGRRILIVGNYRDDERADLSHEVPAAHTLKLNRLTEADIVKLSESMLGAAGQKPNIVSLLQRETEGNVFFLIEVVRALAHEAGRLENIANLTLQETILTGGVQAFVRRRLARIPTDASPLLRLAALTGRELDLKVLRTLDPRIDLQRWVTLCADAAVLEASGEQWRFAHDKLRETLVSEVPAGIRANLHEQIARAIETVYLGAPEYASSLTYQWLQAGDNAKTIHYAALAGEQALSSGAYKEAIGFLERALNLSAGAMTAFQAASTEYQLGMAYYGLANLESSQAHMLQALSLLGWHMPATQAQLYTTLVKELVLQLVRLTRRFENYARHPRGELLLASRISSHLTQIGFFSGSMAPSALHTVRSANIAEAAGVSPELARSHAHLTLAISLIPFNRLAQYYSYRSVKVARAVGQPSTLAYSLYITGFYHYTVGHWAQAHASLHEAIDMLTEIGDGRRWREAQANLGYMLGLQGKFAESFAVRANLEMVAQRDDDVQARGWGIAGMGEMSLWLHHSDDALRYLQARIDLIDQFTDVMDPTTPCVALLALAFWRAGQPEKARPQAALGLQHMALLKNGVFHSFHGFASLAEVYLRMWEAQPDDHELAQVARRVTMALRTFSFRFPVYQAWSWRNYGMYLWLAGQPRRARVAWQQSMAVAVRLSLPYDEGLVRYEIGRHLATDDPRRHDELRRAADIFASLDAAYDLAQVQAALAADDGH